MKKILIAITKSNWGGAQRYVFDLATNLPREQFAVTVIAGGNGLLTERLLAAGIRTFSLPALGRDVSLYHDALTFAALTRTFRAERPDVIHLNSSKMGGLATLAARIASLTTGHGALVIFTAHGWAFNEPRPRWQRWLIAIASWLAALLQDRIITIDQGDFTTAQRFIPKRKLTLIPLGIPETQLPDRAAARRDLAAALGLPLQKDLLIIGTIAELTKSKDLTTLINAILRIKKDASLPRFHTVVIGDGEDRERLRQEIARLNLQSAISLAGFQPNAQRLVPAFDIFVLPSLKEGLPYTILEAMAAGIPAVGTAVGGIPDLIRDSATGFVVPPKNPDSLARAIAALLRDPLRRANFGKAGLARLTSEFPFADMMQKTISCYRTP